VCFHRRQPEDKSSSKEATNYTQEGVREETRPKSSSSKEIATSGGGSGNSITMTMNMHQDVGNRKQPEGKLNDKGGTKHPQEVIREESDTRAEGMKRISSTSTGTGMLSDPLSGGGMGLVKMMATQETDTLARNQDIEEAARLSQTWPTPKESMMKTMVMTVSSTTAAAQSSSGAQIPSSPHSSHKSKKGLAMATKEKKLTYPIFH
jgi:hypothetical protein